MTWLKKHKSMALVACLCAAMVLPAYGLEIDQSGASITYSKPLSPWRVLIANTDFNDDPVSTSTVTMSVDHTATILVGMPVKFTLGGTAANPGTYYAVCTAIASNLLTIAGAPLEIDDGDLTAMWIGTAERTVQVDLYVSAVYADATNTALLASDMFTYFKWGGQAAYLVAFECTQGTADTGTEPTIKVRVNGVDVCATGVSLSATPGTWTANGAVDIVAAAYDLQRGEGLELNCSTAGGTGDAQDLTVTCVLVYE